MLLLCLRFNQAQAGSNPREGALASQRSNPISTELGEPAGKPDDPTRGGRRGRPAGRCKTYSHSDNTRLKK